VARLWRDGPPLWWGLGSSVRVEDVLGWDKVLCGKVSGADPRTGAGTASDHASIWPVMGMHCSECAA